MSDFLLEISKRPMARDMVSRLGLPLPMPEPLARAKGGWRSDEFQGLQYAVALQGDLSERIEPMLRNTGAKATAATPDNRSDILIVDATQFAKISDLGQLYAGLRGPAQRLARCGRVILIGRSPLDALDAEAAATRQALEGFTRSLAKELGRKGSTANLVYIRDGAEDRAEAVVRYFASRRSSFVTTQPVHVSNVAMSVGPVPGIVNSLSGKVALVTGGARGIGTAICQALAAEGAKVIVLDRPADEAEAAAVASKIGGAALGADVSDPASPEKIARALADQHGGVDIVIHNAGVTRDRTFGKMSPAEWDMTININLAAVERITRALARSGGPLRDGGRLVVLSSVAGIAGNMGQTNYAASKAGVIGLMRRWSADFASQGITANAIAPGFIETRMTAAIPPMVREAARRLSALGQGGQPEDVAGLATFLSMPHAQGVTGQVIRVCGGALIGA